MANQLSVAEVQSILILRERGWSNRRIARELGIHRETVGRYVSGAPTGLPPPKPAKAPTGSDPNPATAPTGSAAGGPEAPPWADGPASSTTEAQGAGGLSPQRLFDRAGGLAVAMATLLDPRSPGRAGGPDPSRALSRSTSGCEPYRQAIQSKLEAGLSAVRIHRDLLEVHGQAMPSYYSVRRFVRRLDHARPLPFRRMECPPGHEAQVDFGRGAPITGSDGRRRRPHVLRVVLSHSRKGYSEVVGRQGVDEFLGCLENAFHHFGGTPATLVLDNLKAAVSKADWFDPQLNPKFQSFCAHYSMAPARKVSGVERGAVKLLQEVTHIGYGARRWAESVVNHRGVESMRVLQGLLSLRRRYPHEQLDRACGIALGHGCLRLRTLRQLLDRDGKGADRQMELPGFLDEHPIIRPMNDYGAFVHESFLQPSLETYP